jgi:minor extracellular serine protease Vpr
MRTNRLWISVLTVTAVLTLVGTAFAGVGHPRRDFTEPSADSQAEVDYAIVTLGDPPAASYTGGIRGLKATKPARGKKLNTSGRNVRAYVAHLANAHESYRGYLSGRAPKVRIVEEFFYSLNGFAVQLNGAPLQSLSGGPGVRKVSRSWLYRPTMNVSTGLVDADEVWPDAGGRENAGTGIKIGIIDTGIVDTLPFFTACKDEDGDGVADIPHKVYFSGKEGPPEDTIVFDHGSHVSGTAAGCVIELTEGPILGAISGMAPAAELWDYNVFPGYGAGFIAFGGSAFSQDIAEALEDTIVDGMDVVNMSLGGQVQGPHDLLAEAVQATVDAGLVVAVAAGNEGPGDTTVSSPGSALGALTAGASTNPHFIGIPVTVEAITYGAAVGDFNSFGVVTADYTVTEPANGCTAISTDVVGKIALIDRGVCTFTTKVRNAENAGAIGVLVVNNVAGDPVAMAHDGTDPFPEIPAAMLSQEDGNGIKPSGTASVDGTVETEFLTDNADIIAGFSSRGPTPFTYLIKPDLMAPGVNVYSSVFDGEFAMFQGTSMATPHLAGGAAVLLDLHPSWSPDDVKSAMVNTAARVVTDHVTGTEDPGVLSRGGGRLDLDAANETPLTMSPASASFGFFSGNKNVVGSVDILVLNVSGGAQTCSVAVTGPDIVTASTDAITMGSGESTTVTLSLDGGGAGETGSGDYDGDVEIDCGDVLMRLPWWTRIDRHGKP